MTVGVARRTHVAGWLLLLLLLVSCSPAPLAVPPGPDPRPVDLPSQDADTVTPTGQVTVAYPAPASTFLPPVGEEPAGDDLAAIWGLPLLRVGPDGQLRPGLVADWEVVGRTGAGWEVLLHLREGRWSDGTPVVARDVVASLERLVRRDPARFGALTQVGASAGDRVRLVFSGPHAGWSDLLLEAGTMLPADLVEGAAESFAADIPVSGGPFHLAAHDPGRRLVFEAHEASPMGAPQLERLVVLPVPSFETALGLLERDEVDVALGHLALNPVGRAEEIDGVRAAAPLGGTTVALRFREDGALGGADAAGWRRGIVGAIDVEELVEGLLGRHGHPTRSPWPGEPVPSTVPTGEVPDGMTMTLVHPQEGEALAFTVRSIQRDLRARGLTVELAPELRPEFTATARRTYDASLQVHRSGPRPSLVPWMDDPADARAARAAGPRSAGVREGLEAVATPARLGPLYRIGVAHAWHDVEGLRPSSWLGAGFWNVGEWSRSP